MSMVRRVLRDGDGGWRLCDRVYRPLNTVSVTSNVMEAGGGRL